MFGLIQIPAHLICEPTSRERSLCFRRRYALLAPKLLYFLKKLLSNLLLAASSTDCSNTLMGASTKKLVRRADFGPDCGHSLMGAILIGNMLLSLDPVEFDMICGLVFWSI